VTKPQAEQTDLWDILEKFAEIIIHLLITSITLSYSSHK